MTSAVLRDEPPIKSCRGVYDRASVARPWFGHSQVAVGHPEVDRHASCRPATLKIREERGRPLCRTASADVFEAVVEGVLRIVLELAHEAAHAD